VVVDPSSVAFLLQRSLAQQGIVTANKSAPKPTFSTSSHGFGPGNHLSGKRVIQALFYWLATMPVGVEKDFAIGACR
jgi:hypothetical protein